MNISKCQFLIFALFLVNLLEEGNALRCFTCALEHSVDCGDPFHMENNAWAGECQYSDEICVKIRTPATYSNPENIKRGCVIKNYCSAFETVSESCLTCDTHLCNIAPSIGPNTALTTIIVGYVLQRLL